MTSDRCPLNVAQGEGIPGLLVDFLTAAVCRNMLCGLFTPRWISRKASNGVLFFWGNERAG